MPIIAKKTESDYTPAPEGLHQAVCVDVVDQGMRDTPWGTKHKVQFRWQTEDRNLDTNQRFIVAQQYTLSLSDKANLRKDLEAWRGRRFTDEELRGFDLETCIGANCQIQIIHNEKDGKTFGNVSGILPIPKGAKRLEPEEYVREVDRPKDESGTNGHAAASSQSAGMGSEYAEPPQPYEAAIDEVPF